MYLRLHNSMWILKDNFFNFLIQRAEMLEGQGKSGFTMELFIEQNGEEDMVVRRDLAWKTQKTDLVIE